VRTLSQQSLQNAQLSTITESYKKYEIRLYLSFTVVPNPL